MQGQTGQPEFLKRGRELRLSGLGIECELPNLKQTKTNTCEMWYQNRVFSVSVYK